MSQIDICNLLILKKKVLRYSSLLSFALQDLSNLVSDLYGFPLCAEICNGDEIEFRKILSDGLSDPFSCIYFNSVLDRLS